MQTIKQASVRSNCPVCGKNLQVSLKSARVVEDETVYCSKGCFDLQKYLSGTARNTRSPFIRLKA